MSGAVRTALFLTALLLAEVARAFAAIADYEKTEFSPARSETFAIPFELEENATVSIALYTADGDLVRSLASDGELEPGTHVLQWDGRDERGTVVPDEVYVPVLTARTPAGRTAHQDSRESSGGEAVDDLDVTITARRDISYVLPAPSRVLVRAGIAGGPLMRTLANWEPRSAGRNIQRWDGMDASRVVDLREQDGLRILVTGFRLPAHAIITTGNAALDYARYRETLGWPQRVVDPADMALVRDDVRIARQYYVSPAQARNPRIMLTLLDGDDEVTDAVPAFTPGSRIAVRVAVDDDDRWLIDRSLYEVAFFVDYRFVSEEEQGYMPLTWLWTVEPMAAGEHVLTVNLSAFDGKVGVVSRKFTLRE